MSTSKSKRSFREFRLELPSGVSLSCGESGDPSGEPLLLLHGTSDSWQSFRPFMRELPKSIRAIAISLRGHGDSSKPDSAYTMSEFAGDIVSAMDALSITRAAIAGHSMGSLIARLIAALHPERVSNLILMGAFGIVRGHPGIDEFYRETIEPLRDPVDIGMIRGFQESTLCRPVPPQFLDMVIDESAKLPSHVLRGAVRSMLADDGDLLLGRIRAQTTIIWGDRDAYCGREDQSFLLSAIPHARFVALEGRGHALHWEDPKTSAAEAAATLIH